MKKILTALVVGGFSFAALGSTVTAYFEVQMPPHFNNYHRAYVSGNVQELGAWQPKAVALTYREGKLYGSVQVRQGQPFEYKVNLGSWEYVETSANGKSLPNRQGNCHRDCLLQVQVQNFHLKRFHAYPRTVRSRLHYLHDVEFGEFGNHRSIAIYLPPGYGKSNRRYPVMYALDGNHLFDVATSNARAEWGVEETLDYHIKKGTIPPMIVVGIYNTDRRADEFLYCRTKGTGGGARAYAEFLARDVKPIIDRYYFTLRDRENTAILGSSFGGHFALFASHYLGNIASRFGAMSPALWFDNYCIQSLLKTPYRVKPKRLWLDMGDREGWDDGAIKFKNGVRDVQQAWQWIHHYGQPEDVRVYIHKGAVHHEHDWGRRFAMVASYLMK